MTAIGKFPLIWWSCKNKLGQFGLRSAIVLARTLMRRNTSTVHIHSNYTQREERTRTFLNTRPPRQVNLGLFESHIFIFCTQRFIMLFTIEIKLIQDFLWIEADKVTNPSGVVPVKKLNCQPFSIELYVEDYRDDVQ